MVNKQFYTGRRSIKTYEGRTWDSFVEFIGVHILCCVVMERKELQVKESLYLPIYRLEWFPNKNKFVYFLQ